MAWDKLQEWIDEVRPEITELRHDIHRHPELGFEEYRTQEIVKKRLEELGYQPQVCAETGLIADLFPASAGRVKTIALRADIDALPMQETTDLPYRSVNDGRAHKCGHDGHTAVLCGVAKVLAQLKESLGEQFGGNVRLVFQPAEEGVRGGGARAMIDEGAMDGVDEIYGWHNWPHYAFGQLRVIGGPLMAAVSGLEIEVTGVGGHGSQPQLCKDPIVVASALVQSLQTVVSRDLSSTEGAVVSVCTFHAGETHNVLPATAKLAGTIRAYSAEVMQRVHERIKEIADGIAKSYGVEVSVHLPLGYPVLVNDHACAAHVTEVGKSILGADAVSSQGLPMAGAEDFAYFTQVVPGAYYFLGSGHGPGPHAGCHHPDFDFDDQLIPTAMRMMVEIVRRRLVG